MKKTLRVLLALALALCLTPAALAETVIDGQADRNITLQEVGLNEVIDGVSPTTGLTLSELDQPEGFAGLAITGRYMPMLVQIDNTDGGVGDRAPWGALTRTSSMKRLCIATALPVFPSCSLT